MSLLHKILFHLKIDEAKEFTPWRSLKCGKRYSDHNAVLVHMSVNKHSKNDRGKRTLVWNFNDPLGWEKFYKITSSDYNVGKMIMILR